MKRDRRLSIIAVTSILIAGYIASLVFIFQEEPLIKPIGTLGFLFLMGLGGRLLFIGRPPGFTTIFRSNIIGDVFLIVAVAVLAIRLISIGAAGLVLSTTDTLLGGMAAICESWFVHGLLQTGAARLIDFGGNNIPGNLLGVGLGAGLAPLLHGYVYGTSPGALIYVAGSFAVLCLAYWLSGERIEVPIIIHAIINIFG